jgi:methylamine dehydrogenase heavy chain
MFRAFTAVLALSLAATTAAAGEFRPDQMSVATLERAPGARWMWVGDVNFPFMADGRAYLVEVGSGAFLGMISTGSLFMKLDLPADRQHVYAAGTFFERLVRGKRTDVVTIFDPRTLGVVGEIVIPPARLTSIPSPITSGITDDQRFLVIYNMTPAQSASVIDLRERRFVEEVQTAGCAMAIPGGERRFTMICSDGSLMTLVLDATGREAGRLRSKAFFDPQQDPVLEKPVRIADQWYFVSFTNEVHPVDLGRGEARFDARWSLVTEAERAESWRIGGIQNLAAHEKRGLLFALMHQGGADTHKDPGTEVWVFDVEKRSRVQRIALRQPATSIQVTADDAPLLVTALIGVPELDVYAVGDGAHQRTIGGIGTTITLLQND